MNPRRVCYVYRISELKPGTATIEPETMHRADLQYIGPAPRNPGGDMVFLRDTRNGDTLLAFSREWNLRD